MVIVCEECGARFRLNPALLKGAKAARVRCRRCGGNIVVSLPGEPPVPPAPLPIEKEAVSPEVSAPAPRDQEEEEPGLPSPAGEPPGLEEPSERSFPSLEEAPLFLPVADASPPEPSEKVVDSDYEWIEQDSESASSPTDAGRQTVPAPWDMGEEVVSKEVPAPGPGDQEQEPTLPLAGEPPALDTQPEENVPPPEEAPLFPLVAEPSPPEPAPFEPEPPPFDADISHAVRSEPEAETSTGTGQEPKPYVPLVGEPEPAPATPELEPAAETAAPEPERRHPSRRPPSMLPVLFMSIAWVLLLAAGALYFGTTKQGQETLGSLFAGWGWGSAESAPAGPVYDIRDVKWYADKRSDGLSLFVIKGAVANVGSVPSAGILIRATLLGNDNAALAETAAFAGNPIDEASLRRMDRAGIKGVLTNRYGKGNLNREIPEGKTLPFVVVFMNYPEKAESFLVKAIDAK